MGALIVVVERTSSLWWNNFNVLSVQSADTIGELPTVVEVLSHRLPLFSCAWCLKQIFLYKNNFKAIYTVIEEYI